MGVFNKKYYQKENYWSHFFKKIIILLILACINGFSAYAQKWGYVDSEYILNQMPEYREAKSQISQIAKKWEEELQRRQQSIDSMYSELKAEEVLLTEEMKDERLQEIRKEEEALKLYRKKVFGPDGLYFSKKEELTKPIRDRVFDAVEKVAKGRQLQAVFDKSGSTTLIYTNPVHDYTGYVLDELGLGDDADQVK